MDKKELLFEEIERQSKDIAIDSKEISKEVSCLIVSEEVVDYYFVRGPFPGFPETIAEFFILTKGCLHDYELRQKGSLCHTIPLKMINSIAEEFRKTEQVDFLAIYFRYGSLASTVMQDKLSNKENMRRFSSTVKSKLT